MVRPVTMDDYFLLKQPDHISVSLDGLRLGYVINNVYSEYMKEKENELHIRGLKDDSDFMLKESGKAFGIIKFFKNSAKVVFSYSQSSKNYLCIMNTETSEKMDILCPGSVIDLFINSREDIILHIDPNSNTEAKEGGDDGFFFEENIKKNQVYVFSAEKGMRLLSDLPQIWELNCVKDTIAVIGSDGINEGAWYKSYVAVLQEGKPVQKIYTPERGQLALPKLSLDGNSLAVIESMWSDRGVTAGDIVILDIESSRRSNITEQMDMSFSCVEWIDNDSFIALGQRGAEFIFMEYKSGKFRELFNIRGNVSPGMAPSFVMDGKNNIYSCWSNSEVPPEIHSIDTHFSKEQKLTQINSKLEDLKKYEWNDIGWNSDDGLEIHGFLRNKGKNMPLIVIVHGGPTGSIKETFIDRYSFLLEEGYSIFMPNFRGSTGRGRKFAESNYGDMGGMDLKDILSGIEMLVRNGMADPEKIFITGGSYGGFMTKWAITQSNIFKGAIPLFGISDWVSFHGTTNIAEWDENQYGESPYAFSKFVKFSPLRYVNNISCDVMIMHGVNDPCVPVSQAFQFYRALKENGKSVRLLLFPREGHGFMEKNHIMQSMKELKTFLREHCSS